MGSAIDQLHIMDDGTPRDLQTLCVYRANQAIKLSSKAKPNSLLNSWSDVIRGVWATSSAPLIFMRSQKQSKLVCWRPGTQNKITQIEVRHKCKIKVENKSDHSEACLAIHSRPARTFDLDIHMGMGIEVQLERERAAIQIKRQLETMPLACSAPESMTTD